MFINKRKYIFVGLAKTVAKENKKAKEKKKRKRRVEKVGTWTTK